MQLHHLAATPPTYVASQSWWQGWKVLEGLPTSHLCFRQEVIHVTSSHNLLVRTGHVASPATGIRKRGLSMCPEGKESQRKARPLKLFLS